MLGLVQEYIYRFPTMFGNWLCAYSLAASTISEIALVGAPNDPVIRRMQSILWSQFRPFTFVAQSDYPPPKESPELLTNDPTELMRQLT
jgi:hypothetical protein